MSASFNRITPAWFVNDDGEPPAPVFELEGGDAIGDVAVGEALSVDYRLYGDHPVV